MHREHLILLKPVANPSVISYADGCYKEAIRKITSIFPSLPFLKLPGGNGSILVKDKYKPNPKVLTTQNTRVFQF